MIIAHQNLILSFSIAFFLTVLFIKLLIPLANRIGLVDHPGGRKTHVGAIPLVGGIAMALAFAIGLLILDQSLESYRAFLAAIILLSLTGLLDDFHELTPRLRLCVQIFSALIMILWGNVSLHNLGNIFFMGAVHLNIVLSVGLTIVAVVGVINAINMLDGVDGLLGSLILIQLVALSLVAWHFQLIPVLKILLIMIGLIAAYLWYNFPFPWRKRPIIFMGDAGSMFLGFALVWFMISFSQSSIVTIKPAVYLWFMVVPIFDIGGVTIRRLLHGRSPFHPDREHVHHLLQSFGFSKIAVVLMLSGFSVLAILFGLWMNYRHYSSVIIFYSFVILFVVSVAIKHYLWKKHSVGYH
jgi:UDP-GlcNAc:undecaprenyl-phosphate/decaprenyl-phosphate GlcNAc-1-phosphate transferase